MIKGSSHDIDIVKILLFDKCKKKTSTTQDSSYHTIESATLFVIAFAILRASHKAP